MVCFRLSLLFTEVGIDAECRFGHFPRAGDACDVR